MEAALRTRIESRLSIKRIKLCGKRTAYEASVFIDGYYYETIKGTKDLCISELVRKAIRKDGIEAKGG